MSEKPAILPHNKYISDLRELVETKEKKKKLDAESRKCESVIKTLKTAIFLALGGNSKGRCGNYAIEVTPEKQNPGALTLHDGRKIPLSDLTQIVYLANGEPTVFLASDVKTWYGGATTGADLVISTTGETA